MKKKTLSFILFFILMSFCFKLDVFSQNSISESDEVQKTFIKMKQAEIIFNKGKEFFVKKDYKEAKNQFYQVLKISKEHSLCQFYLSQIYYFQKKYNKAIDYITDAKKNFKISIESQIDNFKKNIVHLKNKNKKRAINIEEMPTNCKNTEKHRKARQYNKIKNNERIIMKFEEKISNLKKSNGIPSEYYYLHGNILVKQKENKDAKIQYKKAININPKNKQAYTNLITLFLMEKNIKEANIYLAKSKKHKIQLNKKLLQYLKQN